MRVRLFHVKHANDISIFQRTIAQRFLPARPRRRSARRSGPSPRRRGEDPPRSARAPRRPARAPSRAPAARPEKRADAFQASARPARPKTCALRRDPQARQAADRSRRPFSPIWRTRGIGAGRASLGEVDLGPNRQRWASHVRRRAAAAVVQPQRQVRALRPAARSRDALLLDRVRALANAGGVDQNDRIAAEVEKHLDQIAGRSGDR